MSPAAGVLLVATSVLDDPNFHRAVVWVAEHGDDGTLGFIINRPLEMPLADLWEGCPDSLSSLCCAAEGGPVERNKGLLVHGLATMPDTAPLHHGLYVGGSLDHLAKRWSNGPDSFGPRLFLGHSGWSPGQLDREIASGAWTLRPGRLDLILRPPTDGDALWQELAHRRASETGEPSVN